VSLAGASVPVAMAAAGSMAKARAVKEMSLVCMLVPGFYENLCRSFNRNVTVMVSVIIDYCQHDLSLNLFNVLILCYPAIF
jgi:hypothetical protein